MMRLIFTALAGITAGLLTFAFSQNPWTSWIAGLMVALVFIILWTILAWLNRLFGGGEPKRKSDDGLFDEIFDSDND